jgi:hypothetical protein
MLVQMAVMERAMVRVVVAVLTVITKELQGQVVQEQTA